MTRTLGNVLPDALRQLLDGADVAARDGSNPTFLLVTNAERGWPHVAMLSVGELIAVGPRTLRCGLWPGSTTTTNLSRAGRALLAVVVNGQAYYLRLAASRGEDLDLGPDGRVAYFSLEVQEVLEDIAEYATLTSGVTFRLHQPEQVVPRWQHTVDALKSAAHILIRSKPMVLDDGSPPRRWLSGFGALDWHTDERAYAALLDALTRDRLEVEAVEREMQATARRSLADVQEDQQRAERDELAEARRELNDFRAAMTDIRQRGGTDGLAEVPYDSRDAAQNAAADVLIQYLVRPGYAEVRTEEPNSGEYIYYIRVDWPRLSQLAEAQGHPLSV